MARIVQKYGGTSVGTVERIRAVADRIKATHDEGNEVVVVVSARTGVTNELVARAKSLHHEPNEREMDMLLAVGEQETIALMAMALHSLVTSQPSIRGSILRFSRSCSRRRALISQRPMRRSSVESTAIPRR